MPSFRSVLNNFSNFTIYKQLFCLLHIYLILASNIVLSMPLTELAINATVGCLLPNLTNLIVHDKLNTTIPNDFKVENGTKIYFACPAHHSLIGLPENYCKVNRWLFEFPDCQQYGEYIFSRALLTLGLVFIVLVFIIYNIRSVGRRESWRVPKSTRNETSMNSTSPLPVTQL